jgi:hypothetical protein
MPLSRDGQAARRNAGAGRDNERERERRSDGEANCRLGCDDEADRGPGSDGEVNRGAAVTAGVRRRRWPVAGRGPRCKVAEVEEKTRGCVLACSGRMGRRRPEIEDETPTSRTHVWMRLDRAMDKVVGK